MPFLAEFFGGESVKYLFALAVAFSLTLYWQSARLEDRSIQLKSVEHEEAVMIPPQAT